MPKDTLLIPHSYEDWNYHPGAKSLPYDYSIDCLYDTITRLAPELDVALARTEEQSLAYAPDADFMLSRYMKADLFERAGKVRWVHISGAGPDHFFKKSEVGPDDFRRRGIVMTTSAGAASVTIAEQVLCYILMFSRRMLHALDQQRRAHWERYAGGEVRSATLGIIGLGTIGSRVAKLAKGLEMTVIATKRDPSRHDGTADEVVSADRYEDVMRRADFLMLSCPITDQTREIINSSTLRLMKPTAHLLNVARGECIDEPALVAALKDGTIAGYAADNHGKVVYPVTDSNLENLAPDSELWHLPNVIITPNCATAGPNRYRYMGEIIVDNYRRIREGREPRTRMVYQGQVV